MKGSPEISVWWGCCSYFLGRMEEPRFLRSTLGRNKDAAFQAAGIDGMWAPAALERRKGRKPVAFATSVPSRRGSFLAEPPQERTKETRLS